MVVVEAEKYGAHASPAHKCVLRYRSVRGLEPSAPLNQIVNRHCGVAVENIFIAHAVLHSTTGCHRRSKSESTLLCVLVLVGRQSLLYIPSLRFGLFE